MEKSRLRKRSNGIKDLVLAIINEIVRDLENINISRDELVSIEEFINGEDDSAFWWEILSEFYTTEQLDEVKIFLKNKLAVRKSNNDFEIISLLKMSAEYNTLLELYNPSDIRKASKKAGINCRMHLLDEELETIRLMRNFGKNPNEISLNTGISTVKIRSII